MAEGIQRAVVTYQAPHGADAFTLCDDSSVAFGRGAECEVRFGYAPSADEGLPRIAGRLVVAGQRVYVESHAQQGHRALEIQNEDGGRQLAAGEAFSPRTSRFEILVRGDATWRLTITVRPEGSTSETSESSDPPTRRFVLQLTDQQYAVLAAYCDPPSRGRGEPATHKEVAGALSYHPNTVREILYDIWAEMFAQQIPMPDVSDKRVAVVEAARVHGLLWNRP